MKNSLKLLLLGSVFIFSSISPANAAEVELDRVAVVVNSGVVLKSEIEDLIHSITVQAKKKNQTLPSDRALRTQVTEKLINDAIIMQLGERMGVQISDAQLDETLANMAKDSKQSLEEFRQMLVSDGLDYEKYREKALIKHEELNQFQIESGQRPFPPLEFDNRATLDPAIDPGLLSQLENLVVNGYISPTDFGYHGFYLPTEFRDVLATGAERYAPCDTKS